jgi:CBS domain-containing protein
MGLVIGKRVEDVMTAPVFTVTDTTPITDIVRLLLDRKVSGMPVVDNRGRVTGVVSEADLLLKEEYFDEPPATLEGGHRRAERAKAAGSIARDVMTSPVVTIPIGTEVFEAARLMHKENVKRLPVVNGEGRLVGIVSRSDLLKVFLANDEDIRLAVEYGLLGSLWPDTKGVTVSVDEGRVTLSGQMALRTEAELLAKLTSQLDGVVAVIDRLTYRIDNSAR